MKFLGSSLNANSKYLAVDLSSSDTTKFRVTGHSDSSIIFICSNDPEAPYSELIYKTASNMGYTDEEIDLSEYTGYAVFNFTDTDVYPPKVEAIVESVDSGSVKNLTSNLVLSTTPITLESGLYFTDSYGIYFNSVSTPNQFVGTNQIVYIDNDTQTIWSTFENAVYDDLENLWFRNQNDYIEDELTNTRGKIPSSYAVYQALQNIPSGSSFYNELTSDIVLNADVTTTPVLTACYYHNGNTYTIGDGEHNYNNYQIK